MTSPSRIGRRSCPSTTTENLSLRRLPELVTATAHGDVRRAVDAAVAKADFAKAPRNKLYAHRDLQTALTSGAPGFDLGSRLQMREAIEAAEVALHEVARAYDERPAVFLPHWGYGTADDLAEVLAKGVEAGRREDCTRAGQGPAT